MSNFDDDQDEGFIMDDALLDRWLTAMKVGANDTNHDFYVEALCSFEVTETELESLHEDGFQGILDHLKDPESFKYHKRVNKTHAKTIFRGLERLIGVSATPAGAQA